VTVLRLRTNTRGSRGSTPLDQSTGSTHCDKASTLQTTRRTVHALPRPTARLCILCGPRACASPSVPDQRQQRLAPLGAREVQAEQPLPGVAARGENRRNGRSSSPRARKKTPHKTGSLWETPRKSTAAQTPRAGGRARTGSRRRSAAPPRGPSPTGSPRARCRPRAARPRVRSHCRFRNRGADHRSGSGVKWTVVQSDNATAPSCGSTLTTSAPACASRKPQ
jgi:hypothetical protein